MKSPSSDDPGGDAAANADVLAALYNDIRAAAQSVLWRSGNADLLGATTLAHEVVLKLSPERLNGLEPAHAWRLVGRAMQQVIIDRARQRESLKRGGDVKQFSLDQVEVEHATADIDAASLEVIAKALDEVSRASTDGADAAEVFRLHYFAGMTHQQTAVALGTSESSVRRLFSFAKASIRRVVDERGWSDGQR